MTQVHLSAHAEFLSIGRTSSSEHFGAGTTSPMWRSNVFSRSAGQSYTKTATWIRSFDKWHTFRKLRMESSSARNWIF
jgi:hypothetical protein